MRVTSWWFATLLLATSAVAQDAPAQPQVVAEEFGKEIARAFNERDRKALANLLDFRELHTRAAQYADMSETDTRDFVQGARSTGFKRLVDAYFQSLDVSKGTAKFMRVTKANQPRPLMRFDMGAQGFNYFEFVLETDAKGKTRSVDWFQLNTGELMSVTLGNASQMFANNNPGLLERLFGGAKPSAEVVAKLQAANNLRGAGKHAEALKLLMELPEPFASARMILMGRIQAASLANLPKEHERALELLAARYSSDPAALFMLLDYYFMRKDVPRLVKSLDTVEKRVGVDGVTCQMRANVQLLTNDHVNALKYFDESIRLEPDRLVAHDQRATILVQLARFQDAVDAYQGIEKDFGMKFTRDNFLNDPTFEPLVASKPFRAWLPR